MRTVTLMTENRVGLLSDISYILGKNRVNIEDLDVDVIGEKAIVDLTVRNTEKAVKILEKNGFEMVVKKGVLVTIENNKGLGHIENTLREKGIKLENAEMICGDEEKALFSINVNQPRKASRVISNISLLVP